MNYALISCSRCLLLIRCPFLALSATIKEPEQFHKWLQSSEDFKYKQDIKNGYKRKPESNLVHLVVHSDRHSDLVTYTYGKGGLRHYHPYFDLTADVLRLHKSVPGTTRLSPAETLQLYEALSDCLPQENILDTYFRSNCKNGFLTRNLVRLYELELAEIYYKLSQTDIKAFNIVRKRLRPEQILDLSEQKRTFCLEHIKDLLVDLNEGNMLPVIIFCYDRGMIHTMTKMMIHYLRKSNVSWLL